MVRALALLVTAVALLAACGDPAMPSPAVSSTAQAVAPAVANPKDARGVAPCTLLTAAQARDLGVDPARAEAGSTADLVDCSWPSITGFSSVAVTVDTNPVRRGLTDTYLKHSDFEIFEPLAVDGYPAVRAERVVSNGCSIYVGLSETQAMRVNVFPERPTDSCGLAKRVIAAVLTNIPPQR